MRLRGRSSRRPSTPRRRAPKGRRDRRSDRPRPASLKQPISSTARSFPSRQKSLAGRYARIASGDAFGVSGSEPTCRNILWSPDHDPPLHGGGEAAPGSSPASPARRSTVDAGDVPRPSTCPPLRQDRCRWGARALDARRLVALRQMLKLKSSGSPISRAAASSRST
jgi:hypothetical protein